MATMDVPTTWCCFACPSPTQLSRMPHSAVLHAALSCFACRTERVATFAGMFSMVRTFVLSMLSRFVGTLGASRTFGVAADLAVNGIGQRHRSTA